MDSVDWAAVERGQLKSNAEAFTSTKTVAQQLGLKVATYDPYRAVMGL